MRCTEFLELYSDFRDGLMADTAAERRVLRHLAACPNCMRYDARVCRGVTALRSFSDLEPSAGFQGQLDGRMVSASFTPEDPVMPGPAGLTVGLMVATALALVVWGGWDRPTAEPAQSVAVQLVETAPPPLPAVVANPRPPFVSFADLRVPAFDPDTRTPGATEGTFFTLAAGAQ